MRVVSHDLGIVHGEVVYGLVWRRPFAVGRIFQYSFVYRLMVYYPQRVVFVVEQRCDDLIVRITFQTVDEGYRFL